MLVTKEGDLWFYAAGVSINENVWGSPHPCGMRCRLKKVLYWRFGLADTEYGCFPLPSRTLTDSAPQIKANLVDYGTERGVNLRTCLSLRKLASTFGFRTKSYISISQGVALRASHEWPRFTFSVLPRSGAMRAMQTIIKVVYRRGQTTSHALQSNPFDASAQGNELGGLSGGL